MLWPWLAATATAAVVGHDLELVLDPEGARLEVVDRLHIPPALRADGAVRIGLRADLRPESPGAPLEPLDTGRDGMRSWRLDWPVGHEHVLLRYAVSLERGTGRVGRLAGHGGWLPEVGGAMVRFRMRVRAPDGWTVIAPGAPDGERGWCEGGPLDGIDLVWGRLERFGDPAPGTGPGVATWLLAPDAPLAGRYLRAAQEYLDLYSRLIAPYPYAKFALVENDRQTGWGFPSFTLMGSRVLRLPFIVETAFPHEIVHNWWGNGVFVDWESGNWSEGLTTYFADYSLAESEGRGVAFRHAALQKYADYVQRHRDLPLAAFRARHDERAHAVGYHKGMMVFHMLRRRLGDAAFLGGLRRFWERHRGRRAGFTELREALEAASGEDLGRFFAQWVERTGAPELELADARVERGPGGWTLHLHLRQVQEGPPYRLEVPLAVTLAGDTRARLRRIPMEERTLTVSLDYPAEPVHVQVDPGFDLFRRLDEGERPPTLGAVWGAEHIRVVLPRDAAPERRAGWVRLAERWKTRFPQVAVCWDDACTGETPPGTALWILGRENRLRDRWGSGLQARVASHLAAAHLHGPELAVAAAGRRGGTAFALLWVDDPAALPALARKLPHYGRYGLVAFVGADAQNRLKTEWPFRSSRLARALRPDGHGAPVPEPAPLLEQAVMDRARDGRLSGARGWIACPEFPSGVEGGR